MADFMRVEDLVVYHRLYQLHMDVANLTRSWPREERFELTSQLLRSSNSAPAQLAEKNCDRHLKKRFEGVNRSRGEALESVHHLYMGMLKGYHGKESFLSFHDRYHECVRMLNGMERTLERKLELQNRDSPMTVNSDL